MHQDRRALQQHELLAAGAGFFPAHARSQTRGRQNDGDFHGRVYDCNPGTAYEPVPVTGICSRSGRSFSCAPWSLPGSAGCTAVWTAWIRSSKRPKIIFPAVVCSTLVTAMSMVFEIILRALSTTT